MTLLLSLTYTNMLNYNGYSPGKKINNQGFYITKVTPWGSFSHKG